MKTGIEKFLPHKNAGKRDYNPWMSRAMKKLIRIEKKAYSELKKKYPPTTKHPEM